MPVKKLILNDFFEEENFSLIGVHSTIEDYRLAFLLNKSLDLRLTRQDRDIDNNNQKTNFSIFDNLLAKSNKFIVPTTLS